MPCRRLCTNWVAKKPASRERYAEGQVRCDTCEIFMYPSEEHTHNTRIGNPDSNPENGLSCNCCNSRISTRSKSARYSRYQDPNNSDVVEEDEETSSEEKIEESPFWIASGSWNNWNHTMNNSPIRWGTKAENLWNKLAINDIVFCSASSKSDRIFSSNGIFMIGKVIRKFELEKNDDYYPDASSDPKNFFKYRFELEPIKIVKTDDELLPLVPNLTVRQSINHITNPQIIQELLDNLESFWNIKLNKSETSVFLSEDDFKKILDAIPLVTEYNKSKLINSDSRIPNPQNIQLCAKLQYYCALRIAELLKITPKDINLEKYEIHIGSRNDPNSFSTTTIHPAIKNDLEKYLKDKPQNEVLFPFTRQLLWSYYKKAGELADLNLFKEQNERKIEGMSTAILRESRGRHMLEKGASEGLTRLKLRQSNDDPLFKFDNHTLQELKYWEQKEHESSKENSEESARNYYIITQNEDSKYEDITGKQYAYDSDKSHYKNFIKGTNFIVQTKIDNQNYFVGHGKVGSIVTESPRVKENGRRITDIVAKFSEYTEFPERKIRTEKINKKMLDFAFPNGKPNIPPAMLPIDKNFYDEIISGESNLKTNESSIETDTFENLKLDLPKENLNQAKKEIQSQLLISGDVIDQIIFSLYSGKHVILTGPVGTGKTHLAQLIPIVIWRKNGGYYPETVTATSEWTTQDVIGGIFPKVDGKDIKYIIQKGCVADTISKNWNDETGKSGKRQEFEHEGIMYNGVWLVIDEFNRANMDRAFGPLFTALEYKKLKIPTTNSKESFEELTIPEDYRIIGTLNTFDKHFLFKLSDALKRRFSFIEILPPSYDKILEEIQFVAEKALDGFDEVKQGLGIKTFDDLRKNSEVYYLLTTLYEIMAFVRMSKNLGTAVLIAMFRFTMINYLKTKNTDNSLDAGVVTQLLPHLESLQYWQIDSIMNFVGGRIHEMFRKFDVNKRPDIDRYEEELRNLTGYLRISGTNKSAGNWISKFRTGEISKMTTPISDLDPWSNKKRPNLQKFRSALESLKKEKGYFDDEGLTE